MYRPGGTHPDPAGSPASYFFPPCLCKGGACPARSAGDPERSALLVIDMQNDFGTKGGVFVGAAAARQLKHFTSERIFRFAYSRDGTKIAFERGHVESDAVLLRTLRAENSAKKNLTGAARKKVIR